MASVLRNIPNIGGCWCPVSRDGHARSATLPALRGLVATLLMGLLAAGASAGAWAQNGQTADQTTEETGNGTGQLQEVVVTATRRSEAEQNVPMSIDVISPEQMQQNEVKSFDDFAVDVPNLSFNYSGGGDVNGRGVAIRGIEGGNTTAFYLDDLPMDLSLDPRVVDIDHIEVLEGPQGTLYGARSMGGTIRELTTAPDLTKFSGIADAQGIEADGGSDGYMAYLTLNLPIVSNTLAVRLTPYRGQDPGWITRKWPVPGYTPGPAAPGEQNTTTYECNCAPGGQQDMGQEGYDGLNLQALWKPTANLAIRPKFLYQKVDSNGLPLGNFSPENTTDYFHFNVPEGIWDRWMFYGGTIDYTTPIGTFTSATSGLDRHTRDYEDASEFTSFSYGTPVLASPINVITNEQDITEELRFASNWNFPLQVTAGYYYERSETWAAFNQYIAGFATAPSPVPCFYSSDPSCVYGTYGTNNTAELWSPTNTWSKAYYGQLIWHITPEWSITWGERYSWDIFETSGKLWGAISYPDTTYAASTLSLAAAESDRILTPRYVVQYQPTPNLNIYADAAKGFRPGGGQVPPGLNLCAADYAADKLNPSELAQFGPDWVWEYELGEKAYLDNRRISIDSAVFYINWTNIQEFLIFQCGEGATINSGKAVSKGAEVDISAVPFQGLTLNGGIGYDYARVTEPGALISIPPAGSPIQEVAPLTANAAADYQHALMPNMSWEAHMDWSYTSHRYSVANSPLFPRLIPAYFLLNAKFSILRGPGQYSLYVKNMGGIHPNLSDTAALSAEDPGRPQWTEGPPTEYGVEAHYTF
jgi:iron complex outermembrane recepter protein